MARKLSVIALVLVVLYALLGFVVLPWWLERAIPERLAQHMGWQATVESVEVNPFAMSLEASGLAADDSDGERVLAFDRLYVNLGVLRLVTGIVALENFELDAPFARLDLQEDYSINLARDWRANNPTDQPEDGAEPSDPLKLFLGRLRIAGGEVFFRDFSYAEPEEFRIAPLDLNLNELATWPRENTESDYYLQAAIGNQTVEWKGDFSVVPLYSSGSLRIADVSHTTLVHFLEPYLPYALQGGNLTVSSDYELRSGDQFSLTTSGGEVTITNMILAMAADRETELLRLARIHVPEVEFGLIGRELSMGMVTVDEFQLGLERSEDGILNLLRPFRGEDDTADSSGAAEEGTSAQSSDDRPFRWSLAGIELENSQVSWLDNQPEAAVELTLEKLNLSIGQLSHKLSEPVDYKAGLALAGGGRVNFSGQTTLQPFTLQAGINVADLNLVPLSSYLSEVTNLSLREGLLTLDGNLDLDNQEDPLTGTFAATAQVSSLDTYLEGSEEPLLAWQNLRLDPVEYNLAPARLEIGTLTLSNPNVNVIRQQGGIHNLAKIMPESGEPEASAEPAAAATTNGESEEFIFRIGQIMIESGEVSYADRTLDPVFSTRIDKLNGSVTGLSNVAPQEGKVSLQGRVGDVASMKLDGSVGALGTDKASSLALKADGISLPALSPYLSQYLGYAVESGKLNLNLDYKLAGSKIDASNQILLDRMELGGPVASEQAVKAPVKLGLALLRNSNGVIDVSLPIAGDLASPDFDIAPIIARTFVNLIVRAATSPFSMLGSLADMAGLTGEELGYVSFEPGKVALASGGGKKLEALSQALAKRPLLLLKLRGGVSPQVDGDFLRRQKLAEQLDISEVPSTEERIARLESRYQAAGLRQPLSAYREETGNSEGGAPADLAWEKALVNRLVSRMELQPAVLAELARERGLWLNRALQEDFEVPDDQLFLLEPLQEAGKDDNGKVKVSFELEAR